MISVSPGLKKRGWVIAAPPGGGEVFRKKEEAHLGVRGSDEVSGSGQFLSTMHRGRVLTFL